MAELFRTGYVDGKKSTFRSDRISGSVVNHADQSAAGSHSSQRGREVLQHEIRFSFRMKLNKFLSKYSKLIFAAVLQKSFFRSTSARKPA